MNQRALEPTHNVSVKHGGVQVEDSDTETIGSSHPSLPESLPSAHPFEVVSRAGTCSPSAPDGSPILQSNSPENSASDFRIESICTAASQPPMGGLFQPAPITLPIWKKILLLNCKWDILISQSCSISNCRCPISFRKHCDRDARNRRPSQWLASPYITYRPQ
jgi:hypothetical protein